MTTPTPVQTSETALRTRVWNWAVTNLSTSRLELPNTNIQRPTPDPSNAAATTWARLTIRNGDFARLGLGDFARREAIGVGIVDVYTPKGVGTALAAGHADTLLATFRNQTDGAVVYEEPSARVPETQEPDLFRVQVEIPFRLEFQPDAGIEQVVYPVITISQAAHGFAAEDAVYVASGTWAKAQADSESTLAHGLVVGVPDTGTANISLGPIAKIAAHGLGAGGTKLYLSQGTAGLLTSTKPTTGIEQFVATVLDADRLLLHDLKVQEASL